jgi:hypothetical protein
MRGRPPAETSQAIDGRRRGRAMARAMVDVSGRRPRTRMEAKLAALGGADFDSSSEAASVDATVGFLLNKDQLNVGKLRN